MITDYFTIDYFFYLKCIPNQKKKKYNLSWFLNRSVSGLNCVQAITEPKPIKCVCNRPSSSRCSVVLVFCYPRGPYGYRNKLST